MSDQEYTSIFMDFKFNKLFPKIDELNLTTSRIYNADQSGLLFNKLPSHVFVKKESAKTARGCKRMKSKDRITMMIAIAANGDKLPLAVVGKTKNPRCFKLKPSPLPYTHEKNAWFTQTITVWWILNVFWPYHLKYHGDVNALLLLENCSAHKDLDQPSVCKQFLIPDKCHIMFLPPNTTSRMQPADMGIIATMKVGYKLKLLQELLVVYDQEDSTFDQIVEQRKNNLLVVKV